MDTGCSEQVLGAKRSTRPKLGEETQPAFLYSFAMHLVACSAWLLVSPFAYTDSAKRNTTRSDLSDPSENTKESQGERLDAQTAVNATLKLPTALNSVFSLDAAEREQLTQHHPEPNTRTSVRAPQSQPQSACFPSKPGCDPQHLDHNHNLVHLKALQSGVQGTKPHVAAPSSHLQQQAQV